MVLANINKFKFLYAIKNLSRAKNKWTASITTCWVLGLKLIYHK